MPPKTKRQSNDADPGAPESGTSKVYAPSDPNKLCAVCGACASGRHFGTYTCESCKLFFLRLTQGKNARPLKCANDERCNLQARVRSVCRLCRYKKCIESGMSKDRIVYGRNARVSQKYSSPRKQRIHSEPIIHVGVPAYACSSSSDESGSKGFYSVPPATQTSSPLSEMSVDRVQESYLTPPSSSITTPTSMFAAVEEPPESFIPPGIEGELFLELPDPASFNSSPDCHPNTQSSMTCTRTIATTSDASGMTSAHLLQSKGNNNGAQNPVYIKSEDEKEVAKTCCTVLKTEVMEDSEKELSFAIPLQYCQMTQGECERFSNIFKLFTTISNDWLPKISCTIAHHDISTCLRDVKVYASDFVKHVFLPNSSVFQSLAKTLGSSDYSWEFAQNASIVEPGKVIFPYIYVLLFLPCVDTFYNRIRKQSKPPLNVVNLSSKLFYAVNCLRSLQMTQCEYALLLYFFSLRSYSVVVSSQLSTSNNYSAGALKVSAPRSAVKADDDYDVDSFAKYSCLRNAISVELTYLNNIMLSVLGAYNHMSYLECFESILMYLLDQ